MKATKITTVKEIGASDDSLLSWIDTSRKEASLRLDSRGRAQMGQFFTPGAVAMFMAGMFDWRKSVVSVLDPGAGVGSLSAAFVLAMCQRRRHPTAITLTAYEIDPFLVGYLRETLDRCRAVCENSGISFQTRVVPRDFLDAGASTFIGELFAAGEEGRFDCVIANPPYRKIHTESRERRLLGVEIGVRELFCRMDSQYDEREWDEIRRATQRGHLIGQRMFQPKKISSRAINQELMEREAS